MDTITITFPQVKVKIPIKGLTLSRKSPIGETIFGVGDIV